MATQLFLTFLDADTHLGTNNPKLAGAASGWVQKLLDTSRGGQAIATAATNTVAGPTAGIEPLSGAGLPYEWISQPAAADVTISGTITANLWASESNASANVAINVVVDIIRATTNAIVQIVKSTFATEAAVTTRAANNFTTGMTSGAYTAQTLNAGDRLRIRMFGDDAGTMASGFTFAASFGNPIAASDGDSYVTFTENITFVDGGTAFVTQSTTGSSQNIGNITANTKIAQSFTTTSSTPLKRVEISFGVKTGAPADTVIIELQTDSAGSPSGVVLISDTVHGFHLAVSALTVSLDLPYPTAPSTTYWIVASRSGALDASNFAAIRTGASDSSYTGGTSKLWNGSSWSAANVDWTFTVYQEPGVPTVVYLTDVTSDVATASVDREAWTSRGSGVASDVTNTVAGFASPVQVTDTAGGTVVDWFTKKLQAVTLSGLIQAGIRASESNAAANASLRIEIARVDTDGTNASVWGSWCVAPLSSDFGELTTSEVPRMANVSGDDLAVSDGQRLRIRLYIDDQASAAMASGNTVTTYYGGASVGASGDSYLIFPVALSEFTGSAAVRATSQPVMVGTAVKRAATR